MRPELLAVAFVNMMRAAPTYMNFAARRIADHIWLELSSALDTEVSTTTLAPTLPLHSPAALPVTSMNVSHVYMSQPPRDFHLYGLSALAGAVGTALAIRHQGGGHAR